MPADQKYTAARKEFLEKAKALKPSSALEAFVQEEKLKSAAKKLDDVAGKTSVLMTTALKEYEAYRPVYVKKVETQVDKEKEKTKIKPFFSKYSLTLKAIADEYSKDVAQMAETEKKKALIADEAKKKADAGIQAAAKAAADRHLKAAVADFGKRRQTHMDEVAKLEQQLAPIAKNVKDWHAIARDAVASSLSLGKIGKLAEARKIANDAKEAATKARQAANQAKLDYAEKITKRFQPDRNLGFGSYDLLQDFQKADFDKGTAPFKTIFDKAVEKGTLVLKLIQSFEIYAEQAEQAAKEADAAASVKDIRTPIRAGLATAKKQIDQTVADVLEQIDASRKGGPYYNGQNTLADGRGQDAGRKQTAITTKEMRARALEEKAARISLLMKEAQTLLNAQTQKVPAELKAEEEFKKILAEMAVAAGKAKQAVNLYARDSEDLAKALRALS